MKFSRLLLVLSALAVGATGSVFAQEKKREDVKKEAIAANKAHDTKAGEGDPAAAKKAPSTASRADVKKEAVAANKAHDTKAGEGEGGASKKTASTASRADVKKEATAANKAGMEKTGEAEPGKK